MKLIVITSENLFPKEGDVLNALFRVGLSTLHLRKPQVSLEETENLLQSISSEFHSRIMLHDHFELADSYTVKGLHLNRRNPVAPVYKNRMLSSSCHSLDECTQQLNVCDYVFLSPIFNSLSKAGYESSFTGEQLSEAHKQGIIHSQTIALGGITINNIPLIHNYGFGGVAVLGTLWQEFEKDKDVKALQKRFVALQNICETLL
ncbi:thiamine phosphate synthase [Bacteroides sp. 224]|uniref:thiamine phosphate synthase n=1 Tax=Bacteroides sp. 224 TaxID=2302936 RepID=UPI0013D3FFFC|nr:thiamine phosphate synthase [Bacteroides sp. 224]NDV64443.1 thiamine phosphate synthase [Bacteroides sp. 224]